MHTGAQFSLSQPDPKRVPKWEPKWSTLGSQKASKNRPKQVIIVDKDLPGSGPGPKISPKPDFLRFWIPKHRFMESKNMIFSNFGSPKTDFLRPNIFFLVIRTFVLVNIQQSTISNQQFTINNKQTRDIEEDRPKLSKATVPLCH